MHRRLALHRGVGSHVEKPASRNTDTERLVLIIMSWITVIVMIWSMMTIMTIVNMMTMVSRMMVPMTQRDIRNVMYY